MKVATGLRKVNYDTSNYDYFIASQKDDSKFPKLTQSTGGLSDSQWKILTNAASSGGAMGDNEGNSVDIAHVWVGIDATLHPEIDGTVKTACSLLNSLPGLSCSVNDNAPFVSWAGDAGSVRVGPILYT